jgi:hypothetical protein
MRPNEVVAEEPANRAGENASARTNSRNRQSAITVHALAALNSGRASLRKQGRPAHMAPRPVDSRLNATVALLAVLNQFQYSNRVMVATYLVSSR